jgi:hypothetical protein
MDLCGLEEGSLKTDQLSQKGNVWLGIVRERLLRAKL